MSIWQPMDFGYPVSGLSGLIGTGTTQLTAQPVSKKFNVFQNVSVQSGCILPSSYSPGTEIYVLNRGPNPLSIYPAFGDQIENYGINSAVAINAGASIILASFDQPLTHSPRTWWTMMLSGVGSVSGGTTPGSDGLGNDNGVLLLTNQLGWPTVSGAPGSLYNIVGLVYCTPPTNPSAGAPPVTFGFVSSTQLLVIGGANLPTSGPPVGSNIIWNNKGLLCIA
jgi:hypothetical protein